MGIRAVRCFLVGIAAAFLSSCGSGQPGGTNILTAYLPYVESVGFEAAYVEHEPVIVTLRFSAPLNPRILQGLNGAEYPGGSWIPGAVRGAMTLPGGLATLRPWISEPLSQGPVVDESKFNLGDYYQAGSYRLQVQTADSPESGGLSGEYNAGAPWPDFPDHPNAIFREYSFTVLPAEEE